MEPVESTPALRIKQARQALGLTQEELGERFGYGKAGISTWETGRAKIDIVLAQAMEFSLGVSWRWILTGEGTMWSDGARESASVYKGGDEVFLDRPLIVGAATCGPGGQIEDPGPGASRYSLRRDFAQRIKTMCGGGEPEDLFYLLCRGESMAPTILDKEIVLLNSALAVRMKPRNNGIYLVRRGPHDMEARVKRLRVDQEAGELVLGSDNRTYSSVRIPLDGRPIQELVLGRVCWVGRYLLETDPPADDW